MIKRTVSEFIFGQMVVRILEIGLKESKMMKEFIFFLMELLEEGNGKAILAKIGLKFQMKKRMNREKN